MGTELELLHAAVVRHLDEFYREDLNGDRIGWPNELADLVGWSPPEERT
jgi:hypothetical protein